MTQEIKTVWIFLGYLYHSYSGGIIVHVVIILNAMIKTHNFFSFWRVVVFVRNSMRFTQRVT